MAIYHVLNGDAMRPEFEGAEIEGEVIVFREALIDGDLGGDDLPDFWKHRAASLGVSLEEYEEKSVSEFSKLVNAQNNSEFNLWFEFDLFCQVNMWFTLAILADLNISKDVYAVYTSHQSKTDKHFWNAYGPASTDELMMCFKHRLKFTESDIQFGKSLWLAFKDGDRERLNTLSKHACIAFPYLDEVVSANNDRYPIGSNRSRVESTVQQILRNGTTEFASVYSEFQQSMSIYGFGDTQFRKIYDKVKDASY